MIDKSDFPENIYFENLKMLVDNMITYENHTRLTDGMKEYQGKYPTAKLIDRMASLLNINCSKNQRQLGTAGKRMKEGEALSPAVAADCIYDYVRTSRFITGLVNAIRDMKKRYPKEKIRILDAGCGPWALLSVAAATQFTPEEVRFSLIDIHPESIECGSSIIKNLGIGEYFDKLICGNAVNMDLKEHFIEKPHIVVSEVMNAGLFEEPQFAVTRNLAPQVSDAGLFLPEQVTLEMGAIPTDVMELIFSPSKIRVGVDQKEYQKDRIPLGEIFSLTRNSIRNCLKNSIEAEILLPEKKPGESKVYKLFLDTRVKIYRAIEIDHNESIITNSILWDTKSNSRGKLPPKKVKIAFRPGETL